MSDSPVSDPEQEGLVPPLALPVARLTLEKLHEASQVAFQREQTEAGGPTMWLTSVCPRLRRRLGASVVGSMTDPEIAALVPQNTRAFWVGIETRMDECERCPPEGAACVGTTERFQEGVLVTLETSGGTPQARLRRCERYQIFRLTRRLVEAGVDARLRGVTLASLGQEQGEVVEAFDRFQDAGVDRLAPKDIQLVILGKSCREYGVALLRSTMRHFQNASYRSVHVPTLSRDFKNALTMKQQSPLALLVSVDVLLLDDIDEEAVAGKSWFRKELVWLYERRRDQGLATILTSRVRVGEAFPGASVLKV